MCSAAEVYRQRSTVSPPEHEHGWDVESRHDTSDGYVLYVRCADCGERRVDLQKSSDVPPAPLSEEL